ncbi:hypothetical protein GF319_04205 [Candidatus Bathyarchaeota archaeon]|jgi:ABC-type nickel/cobalt efflux system permease component RcnA|nr:hypothetical protein [Candidatus Bathyarchaeota archaeon]
MPYRTRNKITRTLAVSVVLILLIIIASSGFQPYTFEAYLRFLVIAIMAFLGVPLMWITLRGEKSGDTGEKDLLPEDLTRIHREDLDNAYKYPEYFHPDTRNFYYSKKEELKKK